VTQGTPRAQLEGVGVRVGTTTILRDVDLRLDAGETLGLFGANGSGKTTLLRVLATLLKPEHGAGEVLGAGLDSDDRYDVRRHIGLVGHVPALYPELTLAENLRFSARTAGVEAGRVGPVLDAVGLGRAADRRSDVCSHGMQRRAEFARELMLERELLLLDEPHSALDQDAADLVEALVERTAARGGAAVLASHDRDRVTALADRCVEIKAGTLI
jgi:heme exporter protein A